MSTNLIDAIDLMTEAKHSADAIFMMARDVGDKRHVNALQRVAGSTSDSIQFAIAQIEKLQETPARLSPSPITCYHRRMDAWQLYQAINLMVLLRQTADLQMLATDGRGKEKAKPIRDWAEDLQAILDAELRALVDELAGRQGMSGDDDEYRKMALARCDGIVSHARIPEEAVA